MSELIFIGDVHGKIREYQRIVQGLPTFQLGDMGAGFVPLHENLPDEQLAAAVDLYAQCKPRAVASHECPSSVAELLLRDSIVSGSGYHEEKLKCSYSRTALALQAMLEAHRPKLWVFGHYHINKTVNVDGTAFVCLAELQTLSVDFRKAEVAHV